MSSLYMACRRGSGTPQLESSLVSNNIVYDGTSSERDGMWTLENLKPWDQLEDCARTYEVCESKDRQVRDVNTSKYML